MVANPPIEQCILSKHGCHRHVYRCVAEGSVIRVPVVYVSGAEALPFFVDRVVGSSRRPSRRRAHRLSHRFARRLAHRRTRCRSRPLTGRLDRLGTNRRRRRGTTRFDHHSTCRRERLRGCRRAVNRSFRHLRVPSIVGRHSGHRGGRTNCHVHPYQAKEPNENKGRHCHARALLRARECRLFFIRANKVPIGKNSESRGVEKRGT